MDEATTRRQFVRLAGAAALSGSLPARVQAQASGRIVVVGGGFAGATCARFLRRAAPGLAVTLIEPEAAIVTCPMSNAVIAGLAEIATITQPLDALARDGINLVRDRVTGIDPAARSLRLAGGGDVPYDRLVLCPGIDFKWNAIEGYDEAAAERMPHAWKAGPQTLLLRRRIEAMPDGGVVVIAVPANPYRCPPGPYERASLIAHALKASKPRAKVIVLDAKDSFSKQGLFLEAWKRLYGGLIEWVPFAQAGALNRVDPAAGTLHCDFDDFRADVANVIPPQRAGRVVDLAGLAGGGDWCRVDSTTFESPVAPRVHVLGDAIIAGAMPKSAFAASSQAKVCAHAIAALQAGAEPAAPLFVNTCYSFVAPNYAISVADVYRLAANGSITAVEGAGGLSPAGASDDIRAQEAGFARGWYASIVAETFR